MSSKEIIALPAYVFRIRLAQFIIAILVLILNIVSTAILGGYGVLGYGIFTPIATCIIVAYWYQANHSRQQYYNRWVILIVDCLAVIWWLSLWSVLAQWAAALGLLDAIENEYGVTNLNTVHALTALAAVLGAAEFVLFVISLITFSTNLHRVRMNERQNPHQNPFTNPNYQMNNGPIAEPQAVRQKGGFEVPV